MANLKVEIQESKKDIENKILRGFLREIKTMLRKVTKSGLQDIKIVLENSVKRQPEYDSLLDGQLQAELGIANSASVLDQIISVWVNNIITQSSVRLVGKKISGSFIIKLGSTDYSNILPLGVYDSINNAGQITSIPWLQWLLLDGNITIAKYRFGTSPRDVVAKYSRTGKGLMFPSVHGRWTMPAQFAGTENNNFLTRAIALANDEIQAVLEQEFKKVFK